jgi:DNA invertase Pin-like site-specific DNA recombinase
VVYVRQSTLAQVDRNRESTARQYDLVARAERLGWPRSAVRVIDEDLGVSGASAAGRAGFAELAAQVGLGQVGSCCHWSVPGWPVTTPTGIGCWTWPG